jgi:hypothetical protein
MVALPKYVKRRTKPNGRVFLYYEKFRGTPKAWPRVPLPADPFSAEFSLRIDQCGRLLAQQDGNKWSWQLVDISGHARDLCDPKSKDFWPEVDAAEKVGRELATGQRKTFATLIDEYKDSDAYKIGLGEGSKEGYDIYLEDIRVAMGCEIVAAFSPVNAQAAIDAYKGRPGAARYFRAVLSRLISWGIPRGYSLTNPVDNTEKVAGGGTYSPWPDWAFELFFQYARIGLHLPVYSGLYTGQRSVDIFKMKWLKTTATEMPVVQQKTEVKAHVQIHSEYRQIIDAARPTDDDKVVPLHKALVEPPPLHLREDGVPWTQAGFETAWQRQMTFEAGEDAHGEEREIAAAMNRLREHRIVFHGLRKNAVIMLLEVGCTEDEVGAIVGMSPAMVRHYAKEVRRHHLAVNAMKKLEIGWAQIRTNVLGSAKPA